MNPRNIPFYDFFFGSKELSEILLKEFEPIKSARIEIYNKTKSALDVFCELKDCAIDIVITDSWQGSKLIDGWAIKPDSEVSQMGFLKKIGVGKHEGEKVIFVSGRGNTKIGKKINTLLADTNRELSNTPNFSEWTLKRLGLMRTGVGALTPNGNGNYAISSVCGFCNNENILFRIPKSDEPVPKELNLILMTTEEFLNVTNGRIKNKVVP